MYSNQKLNWETGEFDTSYLSNNYCYFELIEDNTIDIDSIEEVKITEVDSELFVTSGNLVNVAKILNKTVRAVKQLNKEIKEVKEK